MVRRTRLLRCPEALPQFDRNHLGRWFATAEMSRRYFCGIFKFQRCRMAALNKNAHELSVSQIRCKIVDKRQTLGTSLLMCNMCCRSESLSQRYSDVHIVCSSDDMERRK